MDHLPCIQTSRTTYKSPHMAAIRSFQASEDKSSSYEIISSIIQDKFFQYYDFTQQYG